MTAASLRCFQNIPSQDGLSGGWSDARMAGWTEGQTHGQLDGQSDGRMDGFWEGIGSSIKSKTVHNQLRGHIRLLEALLSANCVELRPPSSEHWRLVISLFFGGMDT